MRIAVLALAATLALPALAAKPPEPVLDAKAWLESQGLESAKIEPLQDLEVVVARLKGTTDPKAAEERVIVFRRASPWQSNPKETDPGSKWTILSVGRDLDGDGQPDVHFSSNSGGQGCCTTHYVFKLKPKVKRLAVVLGGQRGRRRFHRGGGPQGAGDDLGRRLLGQRVRARTPIRTSRW